MSLLLSPTTLGPLSLQNRMVMSPMTRSRAIGNVPNALMATYYGQRSSAGLIITEGIAPSPNGLGYARIPGLFSAEQTDAWKPVTAAVHAGGAKFIAQLMHTGRVSHPLNMPPGARVLAPSAIAAAGQMWTDQAQMQALPVPEAMTTAEVRGTIEEYVVAAKNAVAAGFDGIELHGANGYLIEQFIRPTSNTRTDAYGGSIERRARFVLEIVDAVSVAVGRDRVAIRLSPYGTFNDMPGYEAMEEDYTYLAEQLEVRGILYVHVLDHSAGGAPPVPDAIKATFRRHFSESLILAGGYDSARAEADLAAGRADAISFGIPFLANPDLPTRFKAGAALNAPDFSTLYTPGEKGYTDYPALA
jgi:N-ethylmaleimide reductase